MAWMGRSAGVLKDAGMQEEMQRSRFFYWIMKGREWIMNKGGPRLLEYKKSISGQGMNFPDEVALYSKQWPLAKPYYRSIAKKALKLKPDANDIVDIGTGPGFIAIQLAKLTGKKIKAVDLAPNMLKKANELAAKEGVQIETIEADCRKLPFKDASIDLVVSNSLIHMFEDVLPFFKELKRIVRPGGKALIQDFRRNTWAIALRLADFQSNVILKNKPLDGLGTVIKASFTKEELDSLLREAGLTSFYIKEKILQQEISIDF